MSLCCPTSGEFQRGLRWRHLRIRRHSIGLIEPSHQIAMGKQIHSQQGYQIGQAPAELGRLLQETQQQHGDQGDPNLGSHGIGAGTDKGLDLQVLLEGLEEQLDLPAMMVALSVK